METLSGTINFSAGSRDVKTFGEHFDSQKSLLHEASWVHERNTQSAMNNIKPTKVY